MKISNKFVAVSLAATVICALASSSYGTLLVSENFGYTPGSYLYRNGPWQAGGNGGDTIGSGHITYSDPNFMDMGGNELVIQNGTSGSQVATFATQTGDQVYYSFVFELTATDGANDYFVGLNPGTQGPNGSKDAMSVYSYTSGALEIRANADSATAGTSPAYTTIGQTYFVVAELDMAANVANLWVNPDASLQAAPAVTAALSNTTFTSVDDIGFKSQATTGSFLVSDLRVGTTWTDVVPEPSAFVLCGLGMLGGLALVRRMRR